MNRYQPSTFRPAFGVAAFALTVLTLVVTVVVPTGLSPGQDAALQADSMREMPASEIAILPSTIDVVGSPSRKVVIETVNVVARSQRHAG